MDTIQAWDRLGPGSLGSADGTLFKSYPTARLSGDSAFEPEDQSPSLVDSAEGYGVEMERNSRPGSLGGHHDTHRSFKMAMLMLQLQNHQLNEQ